MWTRVPQDSCQTCSSFRNDIGVCAQHGIVVFAPEAKWCEEYQKHGSIGEIAAQIQQANEERDRAMEVLRDLFVCQSDCSPLGSRDIVWDSCMRNAAKLLGMGWPW